MNAKSFFYGVVAALLIFLGGERAYHTFSWTGQVNLEAKAGAASYTYLTQPIARDKSGKPITRAQILDAFIAQAQRSSQQPAANSGPSAPNGKN